MNRTSQDNPPWQLNGTVGRLSCGALSAAVDAARPDLGLAEVSLMPDTNAGQLLALHWGVSSALRSAAASPAGADRWKTPLADVYVRGGDLVATYEPAPGFPYAPQIYWRALALEQGAPHLGGLTLLVSVQTDLLDTRPQIGVRSRVAATETLYVTLDDSDQPVAESISGAWSLQSAPEQRATCLLWRLPGREVSYAEIVLASDFHGVTSGGVDGRDCPAQWALFSDFLEKGVIRRARVQALFLSRKNDVEGAAACCRAAEQESLPLTT